MKLALFDTSFPSIDGKLFCFQQCRHGHILRHGHGHIQGMDTEWTQNGQRIDLDGHRIDMDTDIKMNMTQTRTWK